MPTSSKTNVLYPHRGYISIINTDRSCQAEFTLCTGDSVIKPSEWTDLFAYWQQKCATIMSAQSITMPTPTRTVSPAEKSAAPLASCGIADQAARGAYCSQADHSASACFSITVDATHTLGAFPCLCNTNFIDLLDKCDAEGSFSRCGGSLLLTTTSEVPWPTQLRSTCRMLGLDPVRWAVEYPLIKYLLILQVRIYQLPPRPA
jgi:hypothetical protein